MSAIFGILRFDGRPVSPREIERMGNALAHRGPDGKRTIVEGSLGMGHCLLRVNQEDWHEAQPILDGEVILVADLRLDNREVLAAVLGIAADALGDMPDSAVLLAAYRRWGEDLVGHLLGDFTFAIWDAAKRVLLLGRDHMGQRGLFYHHGDGFLAFATEVQALWAIEDVPRRLSEDMLGKVLLASIDRDPGQTLFEDVAVLPGATLVRLDQGGILTSRAYWQPHAGAEHLGRDEAYFYAAYHAIVEEATACRVRRLLRPPALCFSGGFDSGTIAAVAGPIVAAKGRKLVAVASVLETGESRPVVRDARAAVEAFRHYPFMDLHYYTRGDDTAFTDLETMFATAHMPGSAPFVRRGLYRIAASAGARLVMDGHGGDYTVNVLPAGMLGRFLLRGRAWTFAREFRARMRATGRPVRHVLRQDVLPGLIPPRAAAFFHLLRRGFVPVWRDRPVAQAFAHDMIARRAVRPSRVRMSQSLHHRWKKSWLHRLGRAAQGPALQGTLAGAYGLDFTRPFHDKRVVELGLAIPEGLQFRNGLERHLARTMFADCLPRRLLTRGPGNDAENPDHFRMAAASVPAALAEAQSRDRDGRLSRYVDFGKLAASVADLDETRRSDHQRLYRAVAIISVTRFIAWFDRAND
ncbi:lasso peptide isopeptide bond-forming cyclase [soil metagenome]